MHSCVEMQVRLLLDHVWLLCERCRQPPGFACCCDFTGGSVYLRLEASEAVGFNLFRDLMQQTLAGIEESTRRCLTIHQQQAVFIEHPPWSVCGLVCSES